MIIISSILCCLQCKYVPQTNRHLLRNAVTVFYLKCVIRTTLHVCDSKWLQFETLSACNVQVKWFIICQWPFHVRIVLLPRLPTPSISIHFDIWATKAAHFTFRFVLLRLSYHECVYEYILPFKNTIPKLWKPFIVASHVISRFSWSQLTMLPKCFTRD